MVALSLTLTWLGVQAVRADEPGSNPAAQPPAAAGAPAEKAAKKEASAKRDGAQAAPEFVRVRYGGDPKQAVALDTAIVRYELTYQGRPRTVDLVGVVHIGEKTYYERLNEKLARYDAVLYELIAPKGTRIPRGQQRQSRHPISFLQRGMKQMLELEFQLDHIDYSPKNFVHADLSPGEFAQSMKDRNETVWKLILRAMKVSMQQQLDADNEATRPPSDVELIRALFSRDRALELKRLMARQMLDLRSQMAIFGGEEGSTIITERNKRALQVLKQQLELGKSNVAIFYGAGHLPDFDERLRADFGAELKSTEWLTAWRMDDRK